MWQALGMHMLGRHGKPPIGEVTNFTSDGTNCRFHVSDDVGARFQDVEGQSQAPWQVTTDRGQVYVFWPTTWPQGAMAEGWITGAIHPNSPTKR